MKTEDVIDLYDLCEQNHIKIWIDGGWCVDALLGKQTRDHNDVDIALEWKTASKLREILESLGYRETAAESRFNFVLTDVRGRAIDFHAFILGSDGEVIEGIEYPKESLNGRGLIEGRSINCISPAYMIQFLAPWISKHPRKYVPAVSALCEKFNISLPPEYLDYQKSL